jgi:uncharacterized protein YecE (DUF72 family)
MHRLFVGTSGYNYKHWRGVFYPKGLAEKDWLAFYSRYFATVEINATFYGRFTRETFETWANEVGDGFTFTLKGSRYITHVKRLNDPEQPLQRFFNPAQGLGKRFSCALWQFPRTMHCSEETLARLEAFLPLLPGNIRQAFEFRHDSWFTDAVFALLDRYGAGFVINDSPHFLSIEQVTGDFAYIRFHGPKALYASSYSDAQLKDWAGKIRRYLREHDVYGYFNNDYHGFAIENARTLRNLLER